MLHLIKTNLNQIELSGITQLQPPSLYHFIMFWCVFLIGIYLAGRPSRAEIKPILKPAPTTSGAADDGPGRNNLWALIGMLMFIFLNLYFWDLLETKDAIFNSRKAELILRELEFFFLFPRVSSIKIRLNMVRRLVAELSSRIFFNRVVTLGVIAGGIYLARYSSDFEHVYEILSRAELPPELEMGAFLSFISKRITPTVYFVSTTVVNWVVFYISYRGKAPALRYQESSDVAQKMHEDACHLQRLADMECKRIRPFLDSLPHDDLKVSIRTFSDQHCRTTEALQRATDNLQHSLSTIKKVIQRNTSGNPQGLRNMTFEEYLEWSLNYLWNIPTPVKVIIASLIIYAGLIGYWGARYKSPATEVDSPSLVSIIFFLTIFINLFIYTVMGMCWAPAETPTGRRDRMVTQIIVESLLWLGAGSIGFILLIRLVLFLISRYRS